MLYYVVLVKMHKASLYFTSKIELILESNYVYILYACVHFCEVCLYMILVLAFTKNFVSNSHKRLYGQEKLYMP